MTLLLYFICFNYQKYKNSLKSAFYKHTHRSCFCLSEFVVARSDPDHANLPPVVFNWCCFGGRASTYLFLFATFGVSTKEVPMEHLSPETICTIAMFICTTSVSFPLKPSWKNKLKTRKRNRICTKMRNVHFKNTSIILEQFLKAFELHSICSHRSCDSKESHFPKLCLNQSKNRHVTQKRMIWKGFDHFWRVKDSN